MRPVIVAPAHPPLLRRLRGLSAVLRVDNPADAATAAAAASECGFSLAALVIDTGTELADLNPDHLPASVPLAVRVTGLGPVRRLAPRLAQYRRPNARWYLPARSREQAAEVRILSSLGLPVAAELDGPDPADWDALAELAVYAFYNAVGHGDIDPFTFLGRRYDLHHLPLDPRAPWFTAPGQFLRADEAGTLTTPTFTGGFEPFSFAIEQLGSPEALAALDEAAAGWREFFVAPHPCSSCEAFRVCLGVFAAEAGDGCRGLMAEALAGAEHAAGNRSARVEPWQP